MALVANAYCVDRWEASLVEATPEGDRASSPFLPVANRVVRAISRPGVTPQAYISRNEAQAACRASRKRLCTEKEWVQACKGLGRGPFPYGATRAPGFCNDSGTSPLRALFEGKGIEMYGGEAMNDPRLNQVPNTLSPTGSHIHCTNDLGLYDMVGNLHEWVDDPAGTFRGGYYLDTKLNGPGCDYRTRAHDAAYHDYSTGFRCCADRAR